MEKINLPWAVKPARSWFPLANSGRQTVGVAALLLDLPCITEQDPLELSTAAVKLYEGRH